MKSTDSPIEPVVGEADHTPGLAPDSPLPVNEVHKVDQEPPPDSQPGPSPEVNQVGNADAHPPTEEQINDSEPDLPSLPNSILGRALHYITEHYDLVTHTDGTAYAVDRSAANPQTFRVDSRGFATAARRLVYTKNAQLVLTEDLLGEIKSQLIALAELTGEEEPVWPRVAETEAGVEIDIGDSTLARVAVEPGRVRLIEQGSTTLFYRNPNSKPFVRPAPQGDINKLLPYLNLDDVGIWMLIGWITYTLAHPKVASSNYVILVLKGDRGVGKSTMCNLFIGCLVGPSIAGVQAFPGSQKDLAIAVQNSHVVMYDNLRALTPAQADMLCRCSTSAALSTRKLYTDGEEYMHLLHGALVLNGIHSFIDQSDLAQRCLTLTLQQLDPAARTTEKGLEARFQKDLPAIFRGILDLTADILTHLPNVTALYPERMLEFSLWLAAMEKARGMPQGELQKAYRRNLVDAMQDFLQENLLADAVMQFSEPHTQAPWSGTPAQLLQVLGKNIPPQVLATKAWPQNEISLSLRLKKLKSQLSGAGVEISIGRQGKTRQITVQHTGRSS